MYRPQLQNKNVQSHGSFSQKAIPLPSLNLICGTHGLHIVMLRLHLLSNPMHPRVSGQSSFLSCFPLQPPTQHSLLHLPQMPRRSPLPTALPEHKAPPEALFKRPQATLLELMFKQNIHGSPAHKQVNQEHLHRRGGDWKSPPLLIVSLSFSG